MLLSIFFSASLLLSPQEPDLGGQVRTLFAEKCLGCHFPDSESRKAKREMDAAWDLRAVAREWGDSFAPDLAPLYEVAADRSMPPKDSDVEPITAEEARLLKAWVLALTPMPADGNPFVDMEMAWRYLPKNNLVPPTPPPPSLPYRISIFAGRMHAAVVHFPVALILLAVFLRLISRFLAAATHRRMEFFCLCIGAPSAAVAAAMGWLNAANSGAGGQNLFLHRWIGVAVAAFSLLLLLFHRRWSDKAWYGWLLFSLGIGLAFGAHLGGELVFGESYFRL